MDTLFFSDEAWFHLNGYINSQNSRTWSTTNPHEFFEQPLHSSKVGVWCAISRKRIVGPFFFERTVTSEVYEQIIIQFISSLEPNERHCWFQQDGAPAHTAASTMQLLHEFFGDQIISRGLWPPRSPDLTPPDFFLWGTLKCQVYANNPRTLEELKENIQKSILEITEDTLKKVFENMRRRISICLAQNGGHFQHLL
ncbi:uncharacterized protein LOC143305599 [Osmia lignaria lignaria]|uniref:uncharacterized protein LOC143305599 n=1 Tax=Osmia lignaria lignaria TaxID=1437193 RepID=UPI00402B14D9